MSRRLQIGEHLADYRIVGFLGAGGMGSVYHAVHSKIERPVAIKVLSDVADNSSFRERFFNEARLQSRLHHPNIATLYDFQEVGDLVYIVMEFVDGETLDALISRGYFAVEEALKTFESICEAVGFIHSHNIVHRDIKPQNIKLSSIGTIKMLDFGIAKGAINQGLTRVGGVVGTPNYLSPEQLRGHEASPHSDIWSLGILFYEMLTFTEPFKGRTLAELHSQITTAKFEDPEKLNPAIPANVANIVRKCLTVDTTQRYQNISDLLADVRRAQERYRPRGANEQGKGLGLLGKALFNKAGTSGDNVVEPADRAEGGQQPITVSSGLTVSFAVGGAVLLLMLVTFGIWATMGPATINANVSNVPANRRQTAQQNGPGNIPRPTPAKTEPPQNGITAQSSTATGNERQRVTVDATEGTAEVYRNGEFISLTPLDVEGLESEIIPLTLKRSGYYDLDVPVEISVRKKVNTSSLKRK